MPDPRTTLSALINDSGLTISAFARDVVGRDVRTVRRWLAGDPIPEAVAAWLNRATVDVGSDEVTIHVTAR
jgi:hypothetical protein